jgi:TolB-like protein
VKRAARELGVRYVLEGSVRKPGWNRLECLMSLIGTSKTFGDERADVRSRR